MPVATRSCIQNPGATIRTTHTVVRGLFRFSADGLVWEICYRYCFKYTQNPSIMVMANRYKKDVKKV